MLDLAWRFLQQRMRYAHFWALFTASRWPRLLHAVASLQPTLCTAADALALNLLHHCSHCCCQCYVSAAYAEVPDSGNIIPRGSRVDINLLGLASDPWIDITPPAGCLVRKEHGPHHPECPRDGLIVCDGGHIQGSQGGSTDFMMKFFLSQHDRTRLKVVEDWYAGSSSSSRVS